MWLKQNEEQYLSWLVNIWYFHGINLLDFIPRWIHSRKLKDNQCIISNIKFCSISLFQCSISQFQNTLRAAKGETSDTFQSTWFTDYVKGEMTSISARFILCLLCSLIRFWLLQFTRSCCFHVVPFNCFKN